MSPPVGLVLVHGGQHGADCWDLTVAALRRRAPHRPVLAIDFPGRREVPGDLSTASIGGWVDSAIGQIGAAGLDRVVLVGHSLAGVTVPAIAARLGPDRVGRMIFLAACVPPDGSPGIEALAGPMRWWAARAGARGRPSTPPSRLVARLAFGNGMSREQWEFAGSRLYPESTSVPLEPVDRADMPAGVPRTWILTLRDRALSPRRQRRGIEALGGVDEVVPLNTGHDAMISAPDELAEILLGRAESVDAAAGTVDRPSSEPGSR